MARLTGTYLKNSTNTALNSHQYAYNVGNQRMQQVFTAGNYVDYTYDSIGQLTAARGKEPGGTTNRLQEQMGYDYDAAGNLNWRTNNALIQTFNVNSLNELTTGTRNTTNALTVAGATSSGAASVMVNGQGAALYHDFSFARDGFTITNGNNTFTAIASDAQGHSDTNTVTVNLAATNAFVYDLNGNLRTNGSEVLIYDDENQLITNSVDGSWMSTFVYDGAHRRRIQRDFAWNGTWVKTNETRFVYDGNVIVQHRDGNNLPTLTLTRGRDLSGSFQGAGGIGGLLAMTEGSGAHSFYHADGGGNVTCLLSTNQLIVARAQYDPFGSFISLSGPKAHVNSYWFSSKPIHWQCGKYDYLLRWYAPTLQRWLNRDPIGEDGGLNLYAYVANNPLNGTDALGESAEDVQSMQNIFQGLMHNWNISHIRFSGTGELAGVWNNFSAYLLLRGYYGCGEQAQDMLAALNHEHYDDVWDIRQKTGWFQKTVLYHQWIEATSSNPRDPKLYIDPWLGKIVVTYPPAPLLPPTSNVTVNNFFGLVISGPILNQPRSK